MRGGSLARIIVGIVIAVISFVTYLGSEQFNPVTGEDQHVSLTPQQEIRLGLEAAPELINEFGGLYPSDDLQNEIDRIGSRLVDRSVAAGTDWQFEFHVLDDPRTVNAFALPGGQIFITIALIEAFDAETESGVDTESKIAGVLAHEIVHVLARHSAQRIAKNELTNGLIGAVGVASGDATAAQTAAIIGQLVNMQYGRDDEIESDTIGVCLLIDAGYAPEAMIAVMQVLADASGGQRQPEFFSTHPNPDNRIAQIEEAIADAPQECPESGS